MRVLARACCLAAALTAALAACRVPDHRAARPHTDTLPLCVPTPLAGSRAAPDTARIPRSSLALPRPAPDAALPALDGDTIRLAAYRDSDRDRTVVVNFWTTWCAPCRRETSALAALHGDSTLAVLRFSLDERERADAVRSYVQAHDLPYPVLRATRHVAEQFGGVYDLPTTFVVSRDGRIVRRIVGPVSPGSLRAFVRSLPPGSS